MIDFNLSELAAKKIHNSTLISGSARSGTTIVSKIVHSFYKVELAFEPPMLFSLIPLIDNLREKDWKLLYETYLYEDFFLNSLAGRSINCNLVDDSSIYNVKSNNEISKRLKYSASKVDVERIAMDSNLVFKLPDITPFIAKINNYYPSSKVVIVKRDAVGVLNSLLKKQWFSDYNLLNKNMVWPFIYRDGFRVPFWVRERDISSWVKMTEIDRCAYYYIRVNENVDLIENKIEVKYNELLRDPYNIVENLSHDLGFKFGEKTCEIIGTIKDQKNTLDKSIINKVDERMAKIVKLYSDMS